MIKKLIIGLSIAAIVASTRMLAWYWSISTPPPSLHISHSPLVDATPTPRPTPTPTIIASQGPTPSPTPAPVIIPGARPTDWRTFRDYEWQFEMKIPPNWNAEWVNGLIISGDSSAIRIDVDAVGPDGPGELTTSVRTIAGQEVIVYDNTSFSLKRNNQDIPYYFFRVTNWTPTTIKVLSTFKSW